MPEKTFSFPRFRTGSRRLTALILAGAAVLSLLAGCGKQADTAGHLPWQENIPATTVVTEPAATVPPDGNPEDVSCKGSYTQENPDGTALAARAGNQQLTMGQLNILFNMAVHAFDGENGPDFEKPLDTQICPLSSENRTWQQYFLQQALDSWTVMQAMEQKSLEFVERHEDYFAPIPEKHEEYMTGMPILDILYDEDASFELNEKEQAFLDGIPEMLQQVALDHGYETVDKMLAEEFGGASQQDLQQMAHLINLSYFYFINQTYDLSFSEEELDRARDHVDSSDAPLVTLRQILLYPDNSTLDENGKVQADENSWTRGENNARDILRKFDRPSRQRNHKGDEAEFAQKAHDLSQDPGSAINGGLYANLHRGQLTEPLNSWAFDSARVPEDTVMLKSEYGFHILYFVKRETEQDAAARNFLLREHLQQVVEQSKLDYPAEIYYNDIRLSPVNRQGTVTMAEDILFQDVGHERFTEVPVYLQQDYMDAPYSGRYKVGTHGCGISAFAMLSTYMTDTRMTPGSCARQYSKFGSKTGTDGRIFTLVPPGIGYFLEKRSGFWDEIEAALRNGQPVISIQWHGYFTRGGHYLVLTEMTEDDMVVIRDSNIYNYKRLKEHKVDKFKPSRVLEASQGFWIFDKKILTIPACVRCGEEVTPRFVEDYICPKCHAAMERRNSFLELCGI